MKKIILFLIPLAGLLILFGFIPEKKGATLFLAGDSTMADKPYRNGNPEKGWGQVIPLYFTAAVRVENHAVNGRSTKSFIDEGRWDSLMSRVQAGDYVIIEFGHNDEKGQDPKRYAPAETDYSNNLRRFIRDVKGKNATPILATPIVRRRFDEDGQFYDTHGAYPEAVRKVAQETTVALLDLHHLSWLLVERYGMEKSKELFLHIDTIEYEYLTNPIVDDTHLSAYGAFRICDLVASELRAQVPALAVWLKK